MKSANASVNKALGNLDTATPRQLEKALRTAKLYQPNPSIFAIRAWIAVKEHNPCRMSN